MTSPADNPSSLRRRVLSYERLAEVLVEEAGEADERLTPAGRRRWANEHALLALVSQVNLRSQGDR